MIANPVFRTPAGKFRGVRRETASGEVVQALGIRYGRADRFQEPVAEPDSGAEIIEAATPSPACPQPNYGPGIMGIDLASGLPESEDCLRLSVTMPGDVDSDEELPVLVWLHGGAYVAGAGDASIYDPSALAVEQRVIVVSVTYRLGVLGYCGSRTRPWNLGLLDQREALRWVQRNIAAFGGDPDVVTVFGESAGGDSIYYLMAADDVIDAERPLFRRAIVQSGPVGLLRGRPGIERAYAPVIDALPKRKPLPDLKDVNNRLARAARKLGPIGLVLYSPEYDHPPLKAYRDAKARIARIARRVDVLIGTNLREGTLYLGLLPPLNIVRRVPIVGRSGAEAAIRLLTWSVFDRPTDRFVQRYHAAGGNVTRYRFLGGKSGTVLRAGHAAELPYLFPGPDWTPTAFIAPSTWQQVGRAGHAIRASWAAFARTGRAQAVPGLVDLVEAS